MSTSSLTREGFHLGFAQIVVGIAGAVQLLSGAALLFAPRWFYATIGTFPPFNRHYEGDLGSFLLPLGIGLLVAARDPFKHLLLIRIAVIANLLHTLNHMYDAVLIRAPLGYWLSDSLPLLVMVVLLLLVERRGAAQPAD